MHMMILQVIDLEVQSFHDYNNMLYVKFLIILIDNKYDLLYIKILINIRKGEINRDQFIMNFDCLY